MRRYVTNIPNRVKTAAYAFRVACNKRFPRFFKRPFPRNWLHDVRLADREENAEHSPPKDEHIDLCSIWAVEFYTPTHMEELLRRLERLGWTGDGSRDPVSWLKHREVSQFGQAWMPLGQVLPRDDPNTYLPHPLRADLPANVSYIYGDIFCFTPSLIAIVIEFSFDEGYSRIFDDGLRKERQSYVTPIPTGFRIHEPGTQRSTYIKEARRKTTRLITDWFSKNIPGLCSEGLLEGDLPTCEFVTLRKAQPFPSRKEHDGKLKWYLNHLGLSNSYGSWESKSMPALRLYPSSTNRNIAKYHSILAINEGSWKEQDPEIANADGKESRIRRMHQRMSGLIGIWAIDVLLQGYARHFQDLRKSDFLRSSQHKSKIAALQKIAENVSYSVDIAAVTAELSTFVRTKRPLWFDVETFIPSPDVPETWRKSSLEQLIREQIGTNAKWLRSIEGAVRDHLTQYGTILGMVEDIRIQKKITWLTYALLVLTVVLAFLTFITASEHFPWLRTIRDSLVNLV